MWACVCIKFFQSLNWSKLKLDLPINVAALYTTNKFFACSWFKSTGFKMTDLASWSCSILIHKKDGNWTFQLFEASEVIITKFDSQALHIKEFIWQKVDGRSTTYLFFLSSWKWTFYCITTCIPILNPTKKFDLLFEFQKCFFENSPFYIFW